MVRRPGFWEEIEGTIAKLDAEQFRTKRSKEQRMRGRMLYNPGELNLAFKDELEELHWKESRVQYWVTDDAKLIRDTVALEPNEQKAYLEEKGKLPIRSYNQTDFVKDRVAIEVQLGKYSFIAYDLFVKHLAFYVGDKIDCGIEILPMKSMQAEMSSGPGYYEGALYDLVRQGRGVPAVPLVLVGIAP
tara:strand:+ start:1231 stop:1794 length:564 start_codon:yes stop_codon:yes gene_type:complete